jgi:hypothetical protein
MARHPNSVSLFNYTQQGPIRHPGGPSMMTATIVTHDDQPRKMRRCRCHGCGREDVCTPRTDFKPKVSGGELYCGRCYDQ